MVADEDIFSNVSISVSTEKMNQSVTRMKKLYASSLKHIENIRSIVGDSESFWSDEGQRVMLGLFNEDDADSRNVIEKIKAQTAVLDEISAVYEKTEAAAADSAETLPDNIIDW